MHNKPLPGSSSSSKSQKIDPITQQSIEHYSCSGFIRKQALLFSSWKPVILALVESPHQELLLTVKKQGEGKAEEVVNLTHSRISKKIARMEKYFGFGIIIPSKKKYLLAAKTENETTDFYSKIAKLRNQIRQRHALLDQSEGRQQLMYEESHEGLQFQRCEEEKAQGLSTNTHTPKREIQHRIPIEQEREFDNESFCTALEERPLQEQQPEPPFKQNPLHLQQNISIEEVECLQSDEDFKLLYNFNEGRFLGRRKERLKANLLLHTALNRRELLQSFFHLQLWNQQVKHFELVNRIDKGIHLLKLQTHRRSLFSLPAYAYLMANTCNINGDPVLVLRSLPQAHFTSQRGCNYLNMTLSARVQKGEDYQRLINISAKFQTEKDFEYGTILLQEVRTYQLFLKTTGHLPRPILEWPQEDEQM